VEGSKVVYKGKVKRVLGKKWSGIPLAPLAMVLVAPAGSKEARGKLAKKCLLRLAALAVPLAAFLMLAAPAFAQAVTFQPQVNYPMAGSIPNPADIVRADFDLDGDLDLATANSGSVTIFQNDSHGVYSTAPTTLPPGLITPHPSIVAASMTTANLIL
jgi:hypothetical protein